MFTPEMVLACRRNPLLFKRLCWPGVMFYDKQIEIAESVRDNDETVVPAAHQMGKDFISGFVGLWYYVCHHPVRVITTSVKDDHLRVLWGEIKRYIATSRIPLDSRQGGPLLVMSRELRKLRNDGTTDDYSYMLGMVSEKGEGLAGHHAKYALAIFDEACHDDRTEVLTDSGWHLFEDLTGEEPLLTMDPQTGVADYRLPTAIHKSWYSGTMYECKRRGASFRVTPNHKMLWATYRPWTQGRVSDFRLQEVQTINGAIRYCPKRFVWEGVRQETYTLPACATRRKFYPERQVPMDLWLEFLGWYLSEGSVVWSRDTPGGIQVTQKDDKAFARIEGLIRALGFRYSAYNYDHINVVKVQEGRLARLLLACGRYSYEKDVPRYVGELTPEQIKVFLTSYRDGDGYADTPNRDVFYTSSRMMADSLQVLCYKAGGDSSVFLRRLTGVPIMDGRVSRRDGYAVSWARGKVNNYVKLTGDRVQRVQYDGYVYCATVPPHHTLFTRRDGVCIWSGNSGIEDVAFERTDTWTKRRLIIGNPYHCTNYFRRAVKEGDLVAV